MPILLFAAFIAFPIVEIAVIIEVGDLIGLWPTVGLMILTAVAGTILVRAQGFLVLNRARESLAQGVFPARELLDGTALVAAGLLLLLPGFVSDVIGLVLLVPVLRHGIGQGFWRWLAAARDRRHRSRRTRKGEVIDVEYYEVREDRIGREPRRPDDGRDSGR